MSETGRTPEEVKPPDPREVALDLISRAAAYLSEGNTGLALLRCNEAIRIHPSSAWAYYHRGKVYHAQRHYNHAISDFEQALTLYRRDAWARVEFLDCSGSIAFVAEQEPSEIEASLTLAQFERAMRRKRREQRRGGEGSAG